MSEKRSKKPEQPIDSAERRATRRSIAIGIIVGGVIGVSLGLLLVRYFRSSPDREYSAPQAPIRALPPRPATETSTTR